MSQTYTVTLRLDEMVFTRAAIASQLERYRTRLTENPDAEDMYKVGIRALEYALKTFDEVLPPK